MRRSGSIAWLSLALCRWHWKAPQRQPGWSQLWGQPATRRCNPPLLGAPEAISPVRAEQIRPWGWHPAGVWSPCPSPCRRWAPRGAPSPLRSCASRAGAGLWHNAVPSLRCPPCSGLSAHPSHLWLLLRCLPQGPWKHGRRECSAPSQAITLHRSKVFLGSCKLRAENSQCGFTSCSGDLESRPWSTAALLGAVSESLSAQPVLRSLLAGAGALAQQWLLRVTTLPAEACNCLAGDMLWAKVNALVSCKGTRDGTE